MGSTFSVRNDSSMKIVVVLSQLSALYWKVLEPGETWVPNCGKVWFTVSCEPYVGTNEPTRVRAVTRIITLAVFFILYPIVGFIVTAIDSGITGAKTIKRAGVYAALNKTLVIHGVRDPALDVDTLFFHSEEYRDNDGVIKEVKMLNSQYHVVESDKALSEPAQPIVESPPIMIDAAVQAD